MLLHLLGLCLVWHAVPADAQSLPRPDHVVIVIEENKPFSQIIGNPEAPYINKLAGRGMLFTRSYGVAHPSQPNYLALFSGITHGIRNDACPLELEGGNLADILDRKGLSFATYSESLPWPGFAGCSYGAYYRKHNPAANWRRLAVLNQPFGAFPLKFERLPTVALLVPDQHNDMHDGSVAQGDAWLAKNIEPYVQWAMSHNSLLIVTWDEDDSSAGNQVATLFIGPMVQRGHSEQRINHYNILRTIEEMFGLEYLGNSAEAEPVDSVWQGGSQ
jgi:phosphatidylinositol-3-phosphatase